MEFNATFIVSVISFVLFTVIMNKIFYKPLEKIMFEREKFINENIVDAKNSSDKADEILKNRDEKLAKSVIDAKSIVANKINEANKNSAKLKENAKQISIEELKFAKNSIQNELKNSEKELNSKIDEIADFITSKVLEQA